MPAYKGFDQCVSILLAYAHEGDGFPEELTGCLDEVTVNIILCMLPLSKAFLSTVRHYRHGCQKTSLHSARNCLVLTRAMHGF